MKHIVTRYCTVNPDTGQSIRPDVLMVEQGDEILLDVDMGPDGILHPASAEEARERPWFYTGSPFGQEIVALHRQRVVGLPV